MKIQNQDGRILSVIRTYKYKDELVHVVDTEPLTEEAWQSGVQQAAENS